MDSINLWIVKPAGIRHPPVILYLYSYNATNDRYNNADLLPGFLTREGFAAVGFVSALTEQRFHDRARIQTFVSELQESLGATVHDIQLILNYLAERGDFDMSRWGMWGDGSGASIAIASSGCRLAHPSSRFAGSMGRLARLAGEVFAGDGQGSCRIRDTGVLAERGKPGTLKATAKALREDGASAHTYRTG